MSTLLETRKVALVHDWLNGMRGGEKCLEVFCDIFPQADIYTLIHEKGTLSDQLAAMPIKTSFLQHLPLGVSHYRHYLPVLPFAIESLNLDEYDIIFSSSHCVAKGVKHNENTYHISYVHAPMRYIWGGFDTYFRRSQTKVPLRIAAECLRPWLKHWDKKSSERVDTFLCNSKNIRQQVLEYYGRESQVIYPPVDLSRFSASDPNAQDSQAPSESQTYYLMVGAFAPNKRVDLAIEAFNKLNKLNNKRSKETEEEVSKDSGDSASVFSLKIVGGGQDEEYCRSIAESNIEFLGKEVSDEEMAKLYRNARAFIFPGVDDFGITPLEAQASGTPVIAYAAGGVLETVTEQTGIFFQEQTVEALCDAIEEMDAKWSTFKPEAFAQQTQKFAKDRFRHQIQNAVECGYRQWKNK